ncbi:hypothetical protein NDU88_003804 [Pleurodeles waltl]|uniref:Uncharacterized protein n=1 Tax=Pleurodeles waltl TaxID=8319 RepID=A0AAV7WQ43_PLEWA|nr:hypothetical protein NDU88_003804 [Pleurodeles waltl]
MFKGVRDVIKGKAWCGSERQAKILAEMRLFHPVSEPAGHYRSPEASMVGMRSDQFVAGNNFPRPSWRILTCDFYYAGWPAVQGKTKAELLTLPLRSLKPMDPASLEPMRDSTGTVAGRHSR